MEKSALEFQEFEFDGATELSVAKRIFRIGADESFTAAHKGELAEEMLSHVGQLDNDERQTALELLEDCCPQTHEIIVNLISLHCAYQTLEHDGEGC